MSTFMIIGIVGALLMLAGAIIGATFQDRVYEGQRRRLAAQRREINARLRTLQHGSPVFELATPGRRVILPFAFDTDDSD